MKIAICDDEEVQLDLLTKYCDKWGQSTGEYCTIDVFKSSEEFLFKYEEIKDYDVLFLDIQMKEISGMDLAKKLRNLKDGVTIIFVTGDKDYVFQGYEVQALDYVMKPINQERLFQVLNRAKEFIKKEEDYLFIQSDGVIHKIKQLDICSIESSRHESILYMMDSELVCKKGISELEGEVKDKYFYRCHRSYLVNLSKISSISKKDVALENGMMIPIARGKWDGLNKAYLNYYRGVICQ